MEKEIADIATLIGEPVRARILWALLDGRAYTATELALVATTSPQNASLHLAKLIKAQLLEVATQGRHRYYRFSNPDFAYAIEGLANLIPPQQVVPDAPVEKTGVKYCRTCYDHLAGKVAVTINEALLKQQLILPGENTYHITDKGASWLSSLDIDVLDLQSAKRVLARPCLDWSERRYHLAGALGAALLDSMLQLDWIRRTKHSRAVIVTATGEKALYEKLKIKC